MTLCITLAGELGVARELVFAQTAHSQLVAEKPSGEEEYNKCNLYFVFVFVFAQTAHSQLVAELEMSN